MLLHQLLRIITKDTPIILFDLSGQSLIKVSGKDAIPVDLYEEEIFVISCGNIDEFSKTSSLYIMLKK